jgi:hypothetical protein
MTDPLRRCWFGMDPMTTREKMGCILLITWLTLLAVFGLMIAIVLELP